MARAVMMVGITRMRGSKAIPTQPVNPRPQMTVAIAATNGISTPCQRRK